MRYRMRTLATTMATMRTMARAEGPSRDAMPGAMLPGGSDASAAADRVRRAHGLGDGRALEHLEAVGGVPRDDVGVAGADLLRLVVADAHAQGPRDHVGD